MPVEEVTVWRADWAWAIPIIAVTVAFHVLGLILITWQVTWAMSGKDTRRQYVFLFVTVISGAAVAVTVLHAIEGWIWAATYRWVGAIPDGRSAVLYSFNAMTSYGHTGLTLAPHWQLMGALEALDGAILFGLTTAFLFAMIQRGLPSADRPGGN